MIVLVLRCVRTRQIPESIVRSADPSAPGPVPYSLEKPRSDFTELVIHHVVTLWLVGWSCEPRLAGSRSRSGRRLTLTFARTSQQTCSTLR